MMDPDVGELEYAMSAFSSKPTLHRVGILMSPEGRFLECINCLLRLEFPAGAKFATIAKRFESYSCGADARAIPVKVPTV